MATRPDDLLARMLALKMQSQDVTKVAPPVAQRPQVPPLDLRGVANVMSNLYSGLRDAVNENPFTPVRLPDMGESARPMPFTQTAAYTAGNLLPDISDPVMGPFGELAKAGFKALPASVLFWGPGGEWLSRAKGLLKGTQPMVEGSTVIDEALTGEKQLRKILGDNVSVGSQVVRSIPIPTSTVGGPRIPKEGEFLHSVNYPVQGLSGASGGRFPYEIRDHAEDLIGNAPSGVMPHEIGIQRLANFYKKSSSKPGLFAIAALRGQNPNTSGGGSDFIKLLWEVGSGETTVENAAFLLRIPPEQITPKAVAEAIKDSKMFAQEGLELLGINMSKPLLVWRGGMLPVTGTPVPLSLSREVASSFGDPRPYVVNPKRIQADVEYAIGNMAREREVLIFPKDLHPVTLADVGGAVYVKPESNGLFSVAVHTLQTKEDYSNIFRARAGGAHYSPELSVSIAQTVPGKEFAPLTPGGKASASMASPTFGNQRVAAQRTFAAAQVMQPNNASKAATIAAFVDKFGGMNEP